MESKIVEEKLDEPSLDDMAKELKAAIEKIDGQIASLRAQKDVKVKSLRSVVRKIVTQQIDGM